MITCTKEESSSISKDQIIIGSESDILIIKYDTILVGGYHQFKSIDLDINGDMIPDFQFTSEIWGSPGLGQHPRAKLLSLNNNSLINGYFSIDTTYLAYQTDTSYGENMTKVYIYNTTTYSCKRLNNNDSIVKVLPNQFKILTKKKGEHLNIAETFNSDTITLSDEWYSNYVLPEIHGDTSIYNYYQKHNTCNSLSSDLIHYIGIKLKDSKIDKIGWLKISITDNYKISILESAIQK